MVEVLILLAVVHSESSRDLEMQLLLGNEVILMVEERTAGRDQWRKAGMLMRKTYVVWLHD